MIFLGGSGLLNYIIKHKCYTKMDIQLWYDGSLYILACLIGITYYFIKKQMMRLDRIESFLIEMHKRDILHIKQKLERMEQLVYYLYYNFVLQKNKK